MVETESQYDITPRSISVLRKYVIFHAGTDASTTSFYTKEIFKMDSVVLLC